ncbi:MAG: Flp family type IVb pilin [Brevundimonas sp.]|uniref:Pilus assembly protein Flp/PilA n=1 Tax=Brevundimonas mediterranea TaxID=74329 RepID=A0A7W6A613_9CAUL|nr:MULTISPECIES: Flp family type IVb pilin [Brevundimonas]MBB3872822.1 pilus assembly protein Flp/PilA [Brevundimonas mediterranea]MDK2746610.1 Flp family type IVb pilin [Brevundimonas sp.]
MRRFTARFLNDDRGATAIEYGLICGLIFVAILGGLNALGAANGGLYNQAMQKIADALNR